MELALTNRWNIKIFSDRKDGKKNQKRGMAMKVYEFGEKMNPVIMLLPGTCCGWETFAGVVPGLQEHFRVACVSYDGFDETEDSVFVSMEEEAEKIEEYIKKEYGGTIRTVYGCSLGGTLVGMLAARDNVKISYGIIGSSDFDTAGKTVAKLETKLMLKMLWPMIQTGRMSGIFQKIADKKTAQAEGRERQYREKMMEMFGSGKARPYIKKESIANQFYTDLITVLPDKIDNPHMSCMPFMQRKWERSI